MRFCPHLRADGGFLTASWCFFGLYYSSTVVLGGTTVMCGFTESGKRGRFLVVTAR